MSVFNINLKKSENYGYGFSLLGIGITERFGSPHVIYEIISDSPAAEEKVEAGDIILKINGTDVHRYTTKEVLKCLRLSGDPVTLELKRDPKIKAHIKKYLANSSNQHHNSDQSPYSPDQINYSNYSPANSPSRTSSSSIPVSQQRIGHRVTTSDPAASACRPSRIPSKIPQQHSNSWSAPQSPHHQAKQKRQQLSNIPTPNGAFSPNSPLKQPAQSPQSEPVAPIKAPRFEAYMMTGDLILHLSRTPQSSGLIQPHAKKVDSLRDSPKHALSSYGIDNGKRKNGAAKPAPHAKYDSSLSSSNSLSEEEVSVESVKKSTTTGATSCANNSPSHTDAYGTYSVKQKHQQQQQQQQQPIVDYNNSKDNNLQQINKLERNSHSDIVINNSNSKPLNNDIQDMDSINDSSSSGSYPNKSNLGESGGGGSNTCLDEELLLSSGQTQEVKSELVKNLHNIKQNSYENDDDVDCYLQKSAGQVIAAKYSDKQRRQLSQPQRSESLSSSSSTNRGGGASSSSSHDAGDDEDDVSYSVPTSPTSLTTPILQDSCCCAAKKKRDLVQAISAPTSPETSSGGMGAVPATASQDLIRRSCSSSQNHTQNGITRTCDAAGFRTSKSEDHLQHTQHRDGGIGAAIVPIDIDEDVNSSLNTLLDTRHDSSEDNSDRIVWTYNAPQASGAGGGGITSPPISHSPHTNSNSPSSPQRTDSSVASPTSVSSSIMSSSGSRNGGYGNGGSNPMTCSGNSGGGFHSLLNPQNSIGGGEMSISEAISNISSPDYQDEHDLPSSRDLAMALTDPSDSDSTLLVSETTHQVHDRDRDKGRGKRNKSADSRNHFTYDLPGGLPAEYDNQDIRQPSMIMMQPDLKDSEDELATLTEDIATTFAMGQQEGNGRDSSPPISDDGSDVDSLHSFHYSPKAVDMPSAIRLAKRLYSLDGFKKSDVSRHLSKNNEFSRAVAEEYLKYFLFERLTLDEALRQFLKQFALSGETQERERVLVHFSKRYLDCNPGTFNSQDAVHTLTCAIMLLNTDLHGPNIGRKMTCNEFIENLSELNDGENFPKDVLKHLYYSIKNSPLEWAVDDESPDKGQLANRSETGGSGGSLPGPQVGPNPFLEPQMSAAAVEYKKGYVMRKCCFESNYKKTAFGKRSWKMFYCTLRDLVLYLHKDEHGFRKNQMSDNVHNAIRIHHALATKANDYTKKQHVFRLQTADQSEYLFQTSDSKELQSWIDTINLVCAAFSAPPLEGGVGSQKRFQRPLLPCTHTKLLMKEQLNSHEEQLKKLEAVLAEHKRGTLPTKGQALQNYREKETYLQYELKRYKTYVYLLCSRLNADPDSVQDDSNELLLKPRPPTVPPTSTNLHLNLNVAGMAKPTSTSPTTTPTGAGAGALLPIQQQQPLSPKSQTATNRDETKKK